MLNPTQNDQSLEADRVPDPHMRLSLSPIISGTLTRGHNTPVIGQMTANSSLIGSHLLGCNARHLMSSVWAV